MRRLSADERENAVEILKKCDLFGALSEKELAELLRECRPYRFRKGEAVDNDDGVEFFNIVLRGGLKLMHTDASTGRSIVLFLLRPGDVFDVLSLLDGEKHTCDPVAVEDLTLLRTPMKTARRWLEEYPSLNERFLPYLGHQMRTLESFAESVVFDDTATRLARLILRHADTESPTEEGHYPVRLINTLSHELLAEMIGSVRSVVTTQLQKLKKEELILQKRGYLAIKRLEELKLRYNL